MRVADKMAPSLQYKNGSFVIQTLNVPRIVLNAKYVEEINRTVPEDHLSMADGLREVCWNRTISF